jgi:MFS family permease
MGSAAGAISGSAGEAGRRKSGEGTVRSLVPARLDRLPWSRFHTRLIVALGVCWILDGLEITIVNSVGSTLQKSGALHLSAWQVGFIATIYLWGEVVGALVFGRLSDRLGRRKLFMVTLGLYLVASAATVLTWGHSFPALVYFFGTRFLAGAGIGGEYAAINSAIDELIPADYRGRTDIAVNGTYWAGALIGSAAELFFLSHFSVGIGWRIGFLVGPVIGIGIFFLRRHLPESPRWMLTHGRVAEAESVVGDIESQASSGGRRLRKVGDSDAIELAPTDRVSYLALFRVLLKDHRKRSVLGFTMMMTQSFLYNAIFFTEAIVLTTFFHVSASTAPKFILFFAAGNLLGPLTIGRLFDTIGRKPMIVGTYLSSGVVLGITGWLFAAGKLTAGTMTLLWCITFFIASAAASSAYLTVSELFPIEIRSQAIAIFFAVAQGFGSLGPTIFGSLIGTGSRGDLAIGYGVGAAMMVIGGLVALVLAVPAERRSLEDIATPLSVLRARLADAAGGDAGLPSPAISPAKSA